jgi:hypothetical protein
VDFTTTNTGGTVTYTWTNNNTSIGLDSFRIRITLSLYCNQYRISSVIATITVTPHFANGGVTCDGPAKTFTITVNPTGEVEQPSSQVVCNNGSTAAVVFTTTNTGGSESYSWTNNTTSIGLAASGTNDIAAFTAANTGSAPVIATIIVTPHFTNGGVTCDGPTKTFTITVNPTAEVDQPSSQVVCNGAQTTAVTFTTVEYRWYSDLFMDQ